MHKTSTVATLLYDGLGRRVSKKIENSADWNETYHFYYDGRRLVETRNGSQNVLKQYLWGTQYTDELVQIAVNDDPDDGGEQNCETAYWPLLDANYNVTALVDADGSLKERYEYTPYGERTVYKSAGAEDALCMSPVTESQQAVAGYAHSLCDVGMQGKFFEKECGLYHWDQRVYNPVLARAMQPDPTGYPDGMNRYEWERSNPVTGLDPRGLWNEKFHRAMTTWLAEEAGMNFAKEIGDWAYAPDEYSDPPWATIEYHFALSAYNRALSEQSLVARGVLGYDPAVDQAEWGLNRAWIKLQESVNRHFPGATGVTGEVAPDSPAANTYAQRGYQHGNLKEFADGLHTLQDSWAHQSEPGGTPPLAYYYHGARVFTGHSRTRRGWSRWAWANTDADDPALFPKDAAEAAYATYKWLLKFKEKWTVIQGGEHAGETVSVGPATSPAIMQTSKIPEKIESMFPPPPTKERSTEGYYEIYRGPLLGFSIRDDMLGP